MLQTFVNWLQNFMTYSEGGHELRCQQERVRGAATRPYRCNCILQLRSCVSTSSCKAMASRLVEMLAASKIARGSSEGLWKYCSCTSALRGPREIRVSPSKAKTARVREYREEEFESSPGAFETSTRSLGIALGDARGAEFDGMVVKDVTAGRI